MGSHKKTGKFYMQGLQKRRKRTDLRKEVQDWLPYDLQDIGKEWG